MRVLLLVCALLLGGSRMLWADTVCKTFPATPGAEAVNSALVSPYLTKVANANISIQVFVLSGSGTVGTYVVQYNNVDPTNQAAWIDQSTTYSSAGLASRTDAVTENIRFRNSTAPQSGTVVKVCLYAVTRGW